MKDKYLFICQDDNDPSGISVDTKEGVDSRIKNSENHDEDIDFKVIGRIPTANLTIDFNASLIEWYEKGEKEKQLVDNAVIKIIQRLTGY
jgi:hypothetical protein